MTTTEILALHELAMRNVSTYAQPRSLFGEIKANHGRHFVGILGPRGVGKTVLLQQLAARLPDSLYVSLDMLDRDTDLFAVVAKFHQDYGIKHFFLDEVHYCPGIDALLKKMYDALPIRVWFTSSMALALHASSHDLSRRVLLRSLYPFSFREYLQFRHAYDVPPLSLEEVLEKAWLASHMRAGMYFDDYIRGGIMPFALDEPEPLPILRAILTAVIRKDIPHVARLHLDELDTLEKMITYIGRSPVDGVNYSSLARNLGITKYKAEQYLELFEKAFVLIRVFPKGTNVLQEPKVLMAPPYRLLFRDYADAIGGLREDYFAEAMRQRNASFCYLKTTRGTKTPDFVLRRSDLERIVIEVGGRGKKTAQFKDFTAEKRYVFTHSDETDGIRRPLFMLGIV
jgi:uncharacterized protein